MERQEDLRKWQSWFSSLHLMLQASVLEVITLPMVDWWHNKFYYIIIMINRVTTTITTMMSQNKMENILINNAGGIGSWCLRKIG